MKKHRDEQKVKAVLDALDAALQEGPWDQTNFLRVIGKKLQTIRDNFAEQMHLQPSEEEQKKSRDEAERKDNCTKYREVFVALYSSQGTELHTWERILANLPKQVVSRPIYDEEGNAKTFIRSKEKKVNEAYASFYVLEDDILQVSEEKKPKDRLGKTLLSLKSNALDLKYLNRFVHSSGIYEYKHGRLQKIQNNSADTP